MFQGSKYAVQDYRYTRNRSTQIETGRANTRYPMNADDGMIEKAAVMLTMQNDMNCHVDADWQARGRAWYRAIWIECAELMDHYGGWKWWKESSPDMPQVILEIVDIWHFGLSMEIESGLATEQIARNIVSQWQAAGEGGDFYQEVEQLATTALSDKRFEIASVGRLMRLCESDFDELYRTYVAKNVLNMFRQDHGYKTGTYIKNWNGAEDNEVLADLLMNLDSDAPDFRACIYAALETAYADLTSRRS
jgi:dimeric dUTPase (all-alpha-NTP-PPase superfamily)